jgi:hypothetical protein
MAKTIEEYQKLLAKYEENGPAKLYYSLSRKSWEMADLLNSINLGGVDLEDKDNKKFERLQKLMTDATKVAEACKILEGIAGITGNEDADVKKKKAITPEMVAKGEF